MSTSTDTTITVASLPTMASPPTTTATTTATWADSPFNLIPTPLPNGQTAYKSEQATLHYSYIMAHDMSHLHNMIIRGLNSIWQQAPYVTAEQDIKDFLQYCLHWCTQIHHHHDSEEKIFFPLLQTLTGKDDCMDTNIAQHRAFESGVEQLQKYCVETTPATYSSDALRAIISSFGPAITEHLTDEITSLLGLREYDSAELRAIWKKTGEYARSSGEKNQQIPYMIGTYDLEYEGGSWSEFNFPWPLYWISKWVFSRKYSGAWRFSPCDDSGHRRELQFGPSSA